MSHAGSGDQSTNEKRMFIDFVNFGSEDFTIITDATIKFSYRNARRNTHVQGKLEYLEY